jgi:SAM-dependent methyltransferase
VARIVGVDPEAAMVAEATRAAAEAGLTFPIKLGRAEEVGPELGTFDLVTIGRALHWMEREPTLAALDRMLAPGGRILVCGSRMSEANPWREAFQDVTRAWGGGRDTQIRRLHEHFFEGTRFASAGDIEVVHRQPIDVEALVERALTRSSTSPAALGDRAGAFKLELGAALAPYFANGPGEEIVEAKARIFARAG